MMATGQIFHCVGCGVATNIRDPEAEGNCCDACWLAPSARSSAPAWSDAPPTEPGAYWLRYHDEESVLRTIVVNVETVMPRGRLYVVTRDSDSECYRSVAGIAGQWQRVAPPREG